MEIAKLTTKGQLTLPVSIRRNMGLDAGDKVAFIERNGEYVLVNADRLTVSGGGNDTNGIDNVVASMRVEGFDVGEDSMEYMKARVQGNANVQDRIAQLKRKYTR